MRKEAAWADREPTVMIGRLWAELLSRHIFPCQCYNNREHCVAHVLSLLVTWTRIKMFVFPSLILLFDVLKSVSRIREMGTLRGGSRNF